MVKTSPKYLIFKRNPSLVKVFSSIQSWPKLYKITQYHYIDCAGCDSNGILSVTSCFPKFIESEGKKGLFLTETLGTIF